MRFCYIKISIFLSLMMFGGTAYSATTLIKGGKVWTGDPDQPWAESVLINDNRIAEVWSGEKDVNGADIKVIDAKGRLVLPGFIDNHVHFMAGGESITTMRFNDVKTKEDFINIIANYAKSMPKGEWIIGGVWDHEVWGGELPTKEWVDAVTPDNPLYLGRTDGHMALANSLALAAAGVDKNTKDIEGGLIVRDAHGNPTGMLKDTAMTLVNEKIPPRSEQRLDQILQAATQHALKNGVTQVHNMSIGEWDNFKIFTEAREQERLKIRIALYGRYDEREALAEKLNEQGGRRDDWLWYTGVKLMADGSLGSGTAWFYNPYEDDPSQNGFPIVTMKELHTMMKNVNDLGLQLAVHGIGDQANDKVLDIFDELKIEKIRPRIEHAQHLTKSAYDRFKRLNVLASVHPYHVVDDSRFAERRIGKMRLKGTYAFRSLMDAGAKVSFGSDWFVAPLNPIAGIYAAVTRRSANGKYPNGWQPQEKVTVEEAVKAYTVTNAWAAFKESDMGVIQKGKIADMVILDRDIFSIPPETIIDANVDITILDGKVVYERK